MKITPKFTFASGSFDTDNVKMLCIPSDNHGTVDLCIKEPDSNWNIPIGGIKLFDRDLYVDFKATLEDATALGKEISRRWNEYKDPEEWHTCTEDSTDRPYPGSTCLLRIEYKEIDTDIVSVGYLTAMWGDYGWCEDYLDNFDKSEYEVKITHWKHIYRPNGVDL